MKHAYSSYKNSESYSSKYPLTVYPSVKGSHNDIILTLIWSIQQTLVLKSLDYGTLLHGIFNIELGLRLWAIIYVLLFTPATPYMENCM